MDNEDKSNSFELPKYNFDIEEDDDDLIPFPKYYNQPLICKNCGLEQPRTRYTCINCGSPLD